MTGSTLGVVTDSRTYSPFGELENYSATVSGSPVFETQFTRDRLGRITQKVETIGGTTDTYDYTYDVAGRLTEVKKNGVAVETYSYDANGNRLTFTDGTVSPAVTVSGTYDDQDRMQTYGDLQFTYSKNGELETKTNPILSQTATLSYDVLGNLKVAALPNGDLLEYLIDGQSRRIGKKVNGTLVQGFLYQDQLNPVAELDGTGTIVSRFIYGTKANVPDYMVQGGVTYRIVSDHLGTVRLVIDTSNGDIVQRIDYTAFGDILSDTNPGFQPFGFAGGLYDVDTGLTRFGARDYDSQVGRWTAKDPRRYKREGENLFEYTFNDPINAFDPDGLDPVSATLDIITWGGESVSNGAALTETVLTATAVALTATAIVLVTPDTAGEGSDIVPGVSFANDASQERAEYQKEKAQIQEAIKKCKKELENIDCPKERKEKQKECRKLQTALEELLKRPKRWTGPHTDGRPAPNRNR